MPTVGEQVGDQPPLYCKTCKALIDPPDDAQYLWRTTGWDGPYHDTDECLPADAHD